jgi:hypothetical protein
MIRALPVTIALLSLAVAAQAQAPFSCDPGFEARYRRGLIDTELRTWIVDMARRLGAARAATVWEHLPRELYPCADLGCLSDDQVVAEVARQCTAAPHATLEIAAQNISLFITNAPRPAPPERQATPFPTRP